MATHDYVIANGTGAAVRSDLNNALAAIVSNNSGSSEPGTTYAYQWWADTNANVLKLRNSSNDGWITLRELDGTMLIEDGSASTPGLAFADDTNTGIFSPAADQIGFATGGAERLEIGSSEVVFNDPSNDVDFRVESNGNTHMLFVDGGNDRVGIGVSAPNRRLQVNGATAITNSGDTGAFLFDPAGSVNTLLSRAGQSSTTAVDLAVKLGNTEAARIDTSGRLLVGTSSAALSQTGAILQSAHTGGSSVALGRNDTSVSSGDLIGAVRFFANDPSGYNQVAKIVCDADGTHDTDDYPTRLEFHTTANGASSESTRMVIKENGRVGIGDANPDAKVHIGEDVNVDGTDVDVIIGGNSSNSRQFKILKKIQTDDRAVQFHAATGSSTEEFRFYSNSSTETLRLSASGDLRVAMSNFNNSSVDANQNDDGVVIAKANDIKLQVARVNGTPMAVNRIDSDGNLINFRQEGTLEGSISVSSNTVSYNGGHISRWSQLEGGAARTEILRGSVLSNLDEMCEWAHPAQDAIAAQDAVLYTEEDELPEGVDVGEVKTPAVEARPAVDAYTESNEQLNRMKLSDVEGDVNVAGVFQGWDDDDDEFTSDFYCAMTGDFVIRIAQGTTVARGDLLMSAGDGTAKPQDDDIVRSKTIAKVTSTTVSTTYSDGSYCVPCVLMAC